MCCDLERKSYCAAGQPVRRSDTHVARPIIPIVAFLPQRAHRHRKAPLIRETA
jgi:hypothetical protein